MKIYYPENFYTVLQLNEEEFLDNVNENNGTFCLRFSELRVSNKVALFDNSLKEINLILDLIYLKDNINISFNKDAKETSNIEVFEKYKILNLNESLKGVCVSRSNSDLIKLQNSLKIKINNAKDFAIEKPYVYLTQHITDVIYHRVKIS